MRLLRRVERYREVNAAAERALAAAGLGTRGDLRASALSHGEQRQLEIAMTLGHRARACCCWTSRSPAWAPRRRREWSRCSARCRRSHAILLVEHDMDAVFAVADVLTVMVNGAVLASGPPRAIRASREVQQAYLGGDDAHG